MIEEMVEVKTDNRTLIQISIMTDRVVSINYNPTVIIEGKEPLVASVGDYILKDTEGKIYVHRKQTYTTALQDSFQFCVDNVPDWFMNKVTAHDVMLNMRGSDSKLPQDKSATVFTPEGSYLIFGGDYITLGADGNIYPCTKEMHDNIKREGKQK